VNAGSVRYELRAYAVRASHPDGATQLGRQPGSWRQMVLLVGRLIAGIEKLGTGAAADPGWLMLALTSRRRDYSPNQYHWAVDPYRRWVGFWALLGAPGSVVLGCVGYRIATLAADLGWCWALYGA
jgi:hypothetical protein